MQAARTISVALALATLGVSVVGYHQANAQSLYNSDTPAEFPPVSYKGTQYVDSRGCVYVRAGDGASVHWVPRVTRDRKVLCGFKPTFANVEDQLPVIPDPAPSQVATAQTVPTKPAAPTSKTVQEQPMATVASALIEPQAPVTAQAATPKAPVQQASVEKAPALPPLEALEGKTVGERGCVATEAGGQMLCSTGDVDYILKRLPAGITVRTADGGSLTTTEPTLVRVPVRRTPIAVEPAPVTTPLPTVMVNEPTPPAPATPAQDPSGACANYLGAAAQYMDLNGRYAVRCGPQAVHPSDYVKAREEARLSSYNANRNQVARAAGVASYNLPAPVAGSLPPGYSRAWTDGRLNPNRGPLTARGDLQMAQVWSQTTPAYGLYAPHKKTFWQWLFGPRVTQYRTVQAAPQDAAPVQMSTKSAAPQRVPAAVSTAAVKPQQTPTAQTLRYVQVGTFGVPENAERSIARLSAMGYPVSSQILHRGGKPLKIVLAGPFSRPEQTLSALASVRGAGYGDAFARK
ncbi:SPOR domain-containing protein [Celeribacter sp. ULVN23_4]